MSHRLIMLILLAVTVPVVALAQSDPGLVGHWTFDEGQGAVARDSSGNGNHGQLHDCRWVKRGDGYALGFDGVKSYADCGAGPSLDLTQTVTLEAWIKPTGSPSGEPLIFGKYYDSYGITHYGANGAWFYISGGGNNLNNTMLLNAWNHVVGTFDGKLMTLYLNRVQVGRKESKFPTIAHGKDFLMGILVPDANATDPSYSKLAHWRGELDDVRVYNRALSETEVLQHYKQSAAGYGVNTRWFDHLRLAVYPAATRLVAMLDFSGVFPRPADSVVEATLIREDGGPPVQRQEFKNLPASDTLNAFFDTAKLQPGRYVLRARLSSPQGPDVQAEQAFSYPIRGPEVPSPTQRTVGALPAPVMPPKYQFALAPGGGFTVTVRGHKLPFASSCSYPDAGDNRLLVGPGDRKGEPGWQVTTKRISGDQYEVSARGKHYLLTRKVRLYPDRVSVQDTFRNTTRADLGIIVDNHLDATAAPYESWAVAGYPGSDRRKGAESPSVYAGWKDCGVGMLPLDDVYVVQSTVYADGKRAGAMTDEFGLAAGAEYTLEWAVYPTAKPDYYEFLNRVRKDEGRNGHVAGGFAFLPQTPPITREYAELRNLAYGAFGCLCNVADDPEIEIEGLDFLWLPKERARLKAEFAAIRQVNPRLKLMFHIAHSLISTNKPEQHYPDSRVLNPDGSQVVYPADYATTSYFSPQRRQEGYKWYIYYPTPGNSFHDALMKSVDVLVDDIGAGGAFMDGFLYGYGSRVIYDKWDGHSVEIDPKTRTVKGRLGNVILLSQPSMVEFTRRMNARNAVVVANGIVMTRTIGREKLVTDQECTSGPITHLAQTPCALGNPYVIKGEADVYKDVLDKLSWGLLYFYYSEGTLTYPSLPQRMYPITIEEIHSGTVRGRERLITMHSGVYGWPGSDDLHFAYRYNRLGAEVPAGFLTTVGPGSVRTQAALEPQESAVVRRIPVSLTSSKPVNVVAEQYDVTGLALTLNGQGPATLRVHSGDLAVRPGEGFRVSGMGKTLTADRSSILTVPLALRGQVRVCITPAN
jgi:hypothetical protein